MSGKQSSLNLSIFLFFSFVEIFQCSFNFESSAVKFFCSAEFSVEFSFRCLT